MTNLKIRGGYFSNRFIFLFTLCILCGSIDAQDFKTVHDGVEYAEVTRVVGDLPVRMNLLRLDLKKVRLDVVHAMDAAIGTEKTSSIATRHGAVAAINAGFFRLDKSQFAGDAAGLLVIDGELYSESTNGRTALVLGSHKNSTYVLAIEHIDAYARVYMNKLLLPEIKGINRERRKGEAVLYSRKFGVTTLTAPTGTEVILTNCKESTCRQFEILENAGNSAIPTTGYVISIDPE